MAKLPKSIIKKYGITKKAWRVFKGQRKTKKGRKTKAKSRARKVVRGFLNTSTIFKFLRLTALLAPGAAQLMKAQTNQSKINHIVRLYTGFQMWDGRWRWQNLAEGWTPYLVTTVVTHGVQKLTGMIRRLG